MVKCTLVQALRLCAGSTAHRRSRGIALPFLDHDSRRGEGSASRPGCSLPPEKIRNPLYRRLGGAQGRSGQVRKISPSPEFDPRTVQPVASRYTGWVIAAHKFWMQYWKCSPVHLEHNALSVHHINEETGVSRNVALCFTLCGLRFEVIAAVTMKTEVSLYVTPCCLIIQYQNVGINARRPSSEYYSTINKETMHFSEILHTDYTSKITNKMQRYTVCLFL